MKNHLLLITFLSMLVFAGCKERNDDLGINLKPLAEGAQDLKIIAQYADNVPAAQEHRVLIEDFTGVKCVNCPLAQKEALRIETANPGKTSLVSIHVTNFAKPYDASKYDFRTDEGTSLLNLFGQPSALPQGDINRKIFSGYSNVYVPYNQWSSLVTNELKESTPVNIIFDTVNYNETKRLLYVSTRITYNADITDTSGLYISVMLTESGISDLQLTPQGIDSNYVQNHILRKIIEPINGLKLQGSNKAGQTFKVSFATYISPDHDPKNMNLVAFVHRRDTKKFDVLQVQEHPIR